MKCGPTLATIAVNEDGYCEILCVAGGMKEDKANWASSFQCLRVWGLDGVKLVVKLREVGLQETPRKLRSVLRRC